jgi:hypothetical protein
MSRRPPTDAQHLLILGAAVHAVVLTLLMGMAVLKEQAAFWRNAGGWPIGLRDFVGAAFYPCFFLEIALLLAFSALLAGRALDHGPGARATLASLGMLWTLCLVTVCIVTANNLDNLFAGRPLHWHPG